MSTLKFVRCPECQTVFRVTPQQLALRDGQVRCGRCRIVFNAYGALVDPSGLRIPGPGMAPVETNTMTLRDFITTKEEPDIAVSQGELKTPAAHLLADFESKKSAEEVEEKRAEKQPKQKTPEKAVLTLSENTIEKSSRISQQALLPNGVTKPSKRRDSPTPMALVLDSDTPKLWRKLGLPKWVPPVFYGLGLSILVVGLWAQTVLYFHDALAYQYPDFRSFLAASCGILDCQIEPYHDLNVLAIESSELHSLPEQPQRLALTATIRNRGKQPVAYPLLQFELTDAQDKVSGRRYFAPDVYLDDASRIAQGLGGNHDTTFTLQLESHLDAASGYRLSLVYSAS